LGITGLKLLDFSNARFLFFRKKTHLKREKSSMKVRMYLAPSSEGKLMQHKSL
jgi:hypothetical protein